MADSQDRSGWNKVFDRLQRPSDWVAAGVGALAGAAVSIGVGGMDLGTSISAGAIAGVTAKASGEALLERRRLQKRADALQHYITTSIHEWPGVAEFQILAAELKTNRELWSEGLIDQKKFASELDGLIERYRSTLIEVSSPKRLPPPTSSKPQKQGRPRAGRTLSP